MTPPPETCTDPRCRHKGRPLSLAYFRKGDSEPDCYVYHARCSDCRKKRQIPVPPHFQPSPPNASRKQCKKCHRLWSSRRFPNQHQRDELCMFCRTIHCDKVTF